MRKLHYVNDQPRQGKGSYFNQQGKLIEVGEHVIKRIVPRREVKAGGTYRDMAYLAKIFNHQIIEDEDGKLRWKENTFVNFVQDYAGVYTPSAPDSLANGDFPYTKRCNEFRASLSINVLWDDFHRGMFSVEEWMKFYMQIGYTLCGYAEVFGSREADDWGLPGALKPVGNSNHYTETIIDYMNRVHKGKVLKL